MIALDPELRKLFITLGEHNITPILVGGCVRDHLLGIPSSDFDIELYGLQSSTQLSELTSHLGSLNEVGKSFGVYKLSLGGLTIDFSLPRTESKKGERHQDFSVTTYAQMDFKSAARRRDFTINAIGYNPLNETFLDPYNGQSDLVHHRLMCVDPSTFVEDPLRVLRAVQFAARFDLHCDATLLTLCQTMIADGALEKLPKERIFEEIKKLLLSPKPSIGFELLRQMGGLPFFTPMDLYETTPQDPTSHPEGDVWIHTMMALDLLAAESISHPNQKLLLMLAILLHDCAKPICTVIENDQINAPHHAVKGVEIARDFLIRLTDDKSLIASVLPLIRHHGTPRKLYAARPCDGAILRLSTETLIQNLITVSKADFFGRSFLGPRPARFEAGEWLHERSRALNVLSSPPAPLIMGRDLIQMGLSPSPDFKILLHDAYEAQLNCLFSTKSEAFLWLNNRLSNTLVIMM